MSVCSLSDIMCGVYFAVAADCDRKGSETRKAVPLLPALRACSASDPAAISLDDRFGDRQSQPRPSVLFRTEERFEDPEPDFGRNSMSVIGEKDMRFSICAPGANVEDALGGQRLHRVADQIRKTWSIAPG